MTNDRQVTRADERAVNSGHPRERRHCSRFKLQGDAWFRWEAVDGRRVEGEGVTRNIGKEGAFIETADMPPVAAQLMVVVTLRGRANEGMEARLCGAGEVRHVLRSERDSVGFGARVLFHTEAPAQAG